jgi:hypothetical protein
MFFLIRLSESAEDPLVVIVILLAAMVLVRAVRSFLNSCGVPRQNVVHPQNECQGGAVLAISSLASFFLHSYCLLEAKLSPVNLDKSRQRSHS